MKDHKDEIRAIMDAMWDVGVGPFDETSEKPFQRRFFRDGSWVRRRNALGTFTYKDKDLPDLNGLSVGPQNSFSFGLPRIPRLLLLDLVKFFKRVMLVGGNAEACAVVLWDMEAHRYTWYVPKQDVSPGHVKFDNTEYRNKFPVSRYLEVISAHSHNTMRAMWSGTDNADEKADQLYLVIGRLDQRPPTGVPEYKLRANVGGIEVCHLSFDDIATGPISAEDMAAATSGSEGSWILPERFESYLSNVSFPRVERTSFVQPTVRRQAGPMGLKTYSGVLTQVPLFPSFDIEEEDGPIKFYALGELLSHHMDLVGHFPDEKILISLLDALREEGYEGVLEKYFFLWEKAEDEKGFFL